MDTKLKSDIAESAVVTELLRRGFRVLRPIGDRLPYDLAVDINGRLLRLQVKSAWLRNGTYYVDSRRTKTNRRHMLRSRYNNNDFDFALLYIDDLKVFYVMPVSEFSSYKSEISLIERDTRQRKPRSLYYRENWSLLSKWATQPATAERNLPNSVEPVEGNTEPSPDVQRKGVETRRQASLAFLMSRMKV
jgi:hypothetical protein